MLNPQKIGGFVKNLPSLRTKSSHLKHEGVVVQLMPSFLGCISFLDMWNCWEAGRCILQKTTPWNLSYTKEGPKLFDEALESHGT